MAGVSKPKKQLTGQRFGQLVALSYAGKGRWLCRCDCGVMKVIRTDSLIDGNSQSCGCARRKHGSGSNPTYRIWQGMKSRCFNSKHKDYRHYGGRGITVCERWLDFDTFRNDMGARPDGFKIERIDNDGDYEPGNCRWATRREQLSNTRRSRKLTWRGKTLTVTQWAEKLGISREAISHRLRAGWPIEKVLHAGNLGKEEVVLEYQGERLTVTEWSKKLGIKRQTLFARVYAGWPVERVLTEPVRLKSG